MNVYRWGGDLDLGTWTLRGETAEKELETMQRELVVG